MALIKRKSDDFYRMPDKVSERVDESFANTLDLVAFELIHSAFTILRNEPIGGFDMFFHSDKDFIYILYNNTMMATHIYYEWRRNTTAVRAGR